MSDVSVSFENAIEAGGVDEPVDPRSSQAGRFQPGQSGNPRGRPRKVTQHRSAIECALDERVMIKDSKGTRTIPVKHAIAKRLVQKAMSGDMPALKELQRECPNLLTEVISNETSKDQMNAFARHMLESMTESAFMEFRNAMGTWSQKQKGTSNNIAKRRRG